MNAKRRRGENTARLAALLLLSHRPPAVLIVLAVAAAVRVVLVVLVVHAALVVLSRGRTAHDLMELPDTRWYGKMGNHGWVSRPTRATPAAPTTLTLLCLASTGEAYNAVCAVLARVLEITSRSQTTLERVYGCPRRSRAFPWCPTRRGVPGARRADAQGGSGGQEGRRMAWAHGVGIYGSRG